MIKYKFVYTHVTRHTHTPTKKAIFYIFLHTHNPIIVQIVLRRREKQLRPPVGFLVRSSCGPQACNEGLGRIPDDFPWKGSDTSCSLGWTNIKVDKLFILTYISCMDTAYVRKNPPTKIAENMVQETLQFRYLEKNGCCVTTSSHSIASWIFVGTIPP